MTDHVYSAAQIKIVKFEDAVRKRPGMYFGVARGDSRLATQALCVVARHAFHPATRTAASHTPHVVAEITADLAFAVTDDQADALAGQDTPRLGYNESLLTSERWSSAAVAAVSLQSTVDVWRDGRGFRQRLVGLQPVEPPVEFSAPAGAGTRVTYVLDPSFFGSAVITTDLASLDVHGPHCTDPVGPGTVVIRDRRDR